MPRKVIGEAAWRKPMPGSTHRGTDSTSKLLGREETRIHSSFGCSFAWPVGLLTSVYGHSRTSLDIRYKVALGIRGSSSLPVAWLVGRFSAFGLLPSCSALARVDSESQADTLKHAICPEAVKASKRVGKAPPHPLHGNQRMQDCLESKS